MRGAGRNLAERILIASLLLAISAFANPQSGEAVVPITLGQSVVGLSGPWKFHVGDDPRWADPAFDDSQWETVDLTPTPQTTLRGVPISGFVSGWTARGHAGYAGYAWYRMRVRISVADGALTLLGPEESDGAFQVFANGRLVGSSGDFDRPVPERFYGRSPMFSVSASDYRPGPNGATLLAFRFYMAPEGLLEAGAGGMRTPPIIALPSAANAVWHMGMEREFRRLASALVGAFMYFFFALLIAMMFTFSRTEKLLLWPFAACVTRLIFLSLVFSTNARWMSEVRLQALIDFAATTAWYAWMLTWWAYLGLLSRRWLFNIIVVLGIIDLIRTEILEVLLRVGKASHGLLAANSAADFIFGATSLVVTAAIAYLGLNSAPRGKWPLYLALLFFALPNFVPLMHLLHLRTNWQPFGVQLPFEFLCMSAMLFFFSIVLFGQFRSSLQRQQSITEDLKQAQEVQQLLIPDRLPQVRGWTIESEYHPAREVGGDFFQIIPHPSDGSILIVAGDVVGKGLQAGMMVALLLGAIRAESEHAFDPIEILKRLNRRLIGQEGAQATCLALLVREDGSAMLANAGHLPPYLNGAEIIIEGSLPMGMIAEAEFSILDFNLQPGDRLVLISDGIVEAQNERGELFGFDRIRMLLSKQISTAEMANTAKVFGQQDDISVLSIVRLPVMIEATSRS